MVAFIDESWKPVRDRRTGRVDASQGRHYALAVAAVLLGDVDGLRAGLRRVQDDLGYPIHYGDLRGVSRRRAVCGAVAELLEWEGLIFETARPLSRPHHTEHYARGRLLRSALQELYGVQAVTIVTLETRSKPADGFDQLDARDHQMLQSLISKGEVAPGSRMMHAGKTEPLLWLADVLAGARTDHLCLVDSIAYGLLGHRVSLTRQVL